MAVSKELFQIAETQYRDRFIETYVNKQQLAGTTEEEHGVIGEAYKWPIIGSVEMKERTAYKTQPPPSEIKFEQVTTTFTEFALNVPLDKAEQKLLKPNVMAKYAKRHGEAVGRRIDQFKLDVLEQTAVSIPVGTTNLTVAKLRKLIELFGNFNVPNGDRYIACTYNQIQSLLADEKVTSTDYVSIKALLSGDLDTYLGFKFLKLGDSNDVAKLPKTGDDRTCYAWHRDSVGIAFNMDPTTWIKEDETGFNWLTLSRLKAGADLIQKRESGGYDGVVKIICDETK